MRSKYHMLLQTGQSLVQKLRMAGLSDDDVERRALHPVRGEFTVGAALERFVVTHLEEHVIQLREILARRATA